MIRLLVNGEARTVDAEPATPLLWVIRDNLGLIGTKFGCGAALCGACTVHVDGQPIRSCTTPISAVAGKKITTIEAIGASPVGKKVQAAWTALDVPQCGYCQSGQIMSAVRPPGAEERSRPTPTSTPRWPATSAAAGRTPASAPPSIARPARERDMTPLSAASRREFLKAGAAVGGGLILGVALPSRRAAAAAATSMPNAWVRIGSDDTVTILCARSEMGQGVYTALPTLVAEELEVDLGKIKVEIAPAGEPYINAILGGQITGGSTLDHRRLRQAARGRRAGAHDAGVGGGPEVGRGPLGLPRRKRRRAGAERSEGDLRRAGGGRLEAARPRRAEAQGPQGVALRGQGDQPPRLRRQDRRHRRIRHRREAAGNALRGARAVPRHRRQANGVRRGEGEGDARRQTRGPDLGRRGRRRGHLVAGQDRPRRADDPVGRGRRQGAQHARHGQRDEGGGGEAGRGDQEAGRRGRGLQGRGQDAAGRLRAALPGARDHGADELHRGRAEGLVPGLRAHAVPAARGGRGRGGVRPQARAGHRAHHVPRRRLRPAHRRGLHRPGRGDLEGDRRRPGQARVDARRRHDARLLPPDELSPALRARSTRRGSRWR